MSDLAISQPLRQTNAPTNNANGPETVAPGPKNTSLIHVWNVA